MVEVPFLPYSDTAFFGLELAGAGRDFPVERADCYGLCLDPRIASRAPQPRALTRRAATRRRP